MIYPEDIGMISVGFIALDEGGGPYRSIKVTHGRAVKNSLRVFKTLSRAEKFSPVGKGTEVYIETSK